MRSAPDPETAARCAESFGRQAFLRTIGAELESLAPGRCTLRLPFRPDLTQQHGFFGSVACCVLAY